MPRHEYPAPGARRPRPAALCALGIAVWWVVAAGPAQGQTGRIGGNIRNRESRAAVEGARISIVGSEHGATTDSAGRFDLPAVPAGVRVIQVRAVGYVVGSWVIQLGEGQSFNQEFELDPRAVDVEGVTVSAGADSSNWRSEAAFEQRHHQGRGFFITREDIRRRSALNIADLLRGTPGVMTNCTSRGCTIRMDRSTRPCFPEYFLDGFPATFATGPNFPIQQIRGVEVYRDRFETPPEFQRANLQCGVIAIWTTEPGSALERR